MEHTRPPTPPARGTPGVRGAQSGEHWMGTQGVKGSGGGGAAVFRPCSLRGPCASVSGRWAIPFHERLPRPQGRLVCSAGWHCGPIAGRADGSDRCRARGGPGACPLQLGCVGGGPPSPPSLWWMLLEEVRLQGGRAGQAGCGGPGVLKPSFVTERVCTCEVPSLCVRLALGG